MPVILNTEDGFEVSSVDEYMKKISELNGQKNDANAQLFFRGQAVDYWDIKPSIFRDNMLSVEHYLMSEPLRQVPSEFMSLGGAFEIMEKYQHYGMCTRLLDLTTNPLVALYFACEHHEAEEYIDPVSKETELRCPQGIVYFKEVSMPLRYNDLTVRVISKMASYDLNNETTVEQIVHDLCEDGIISIEQRNRWTDEKGVLEAINLLQNVCTVLPILNNDRLIRQSGAFLLPGKFNVSPREEKLQKAIVSKAECNLREEFDQTFFYINDENKESIRLELEHCNISEANLFPELEYQLRYIRKHNESQRRDVAYFEKYDSYVHGKIETIREDISFSQDWIDEGVELENLDASLSKDIKTIFIENQEVDWIKRDSVLSRIRIMICKKLINNQYSKDEAERIAGNIVSNVIEKYAVR